MNSKERSMLLKDENSISLSFLGLGSILQMIQILKMQFPQACGPGDEMGYSPPKNQIYEIW